LDIVFLDEEEEDEDGCCLGIEGGLGSSTTAFTTIPFHNEALLLYKSSDTFPFDEEYRFLAASTSL